MTTDNDDLISKKSKAQLKREAEAAQALGKELIELSATEINSLVDKLELPERLREALLASGSIKAREARRRQLQFIGKLMRDIELEPVQQMLAGFKRGGQVETAQLHTIERWRERLLSEGNEAFTELKRMHPEVDGQHVQKLITQAHKESAQKQPPRAARLLFKYLRELLVG